jgi:hypothetical protein
MERRFLQFANIALALPVERLNEAGIVTLAIPELSNMP